MEAFLLEHITWLLAAIGALALYQVRVEIRIRDNTNDLKRLEKRSRDFETCVGEIKTTLQRIEIAITRLEITEELRKKDDDDN